MTGFVALEIELMTVSSRIVSYFVVNLSYLVAIIDKNFFLGTNSSFCFLIIDTL